MRRSRKRLASCGCGAISIIALSRFSLRPGFSDVDTTVKPLAAVRKEGLPLQSQEARAAEPLISHLFDGRHAIGVRRGHGCARSARLQALRARSMGVAGWNADCWPTLLRGDKGFGNEATMREAEQPLPYLFKLRLTAESNARSGELPSKASGWMRGQGWQATETIVRLQGGEGQRRIIVLRRVKGTLTASSMDDQGQPQFSVSSTSAPTGMFTDIRFLTTSLWSRTWASFGQLDRDRGDGENIFDELKNQWGSGGFVTRDLARCPLAARLVALFYV